MRRCGPRAQVMSIRLHYLFCGAVLVTLCTGCWPVRITSSPGASGIVLDAKTHAPITGAEAVMLRAELGETPQMENARPPVAVTGNDGRFCIPRERKWILYSISPGLPPATGILAIRHEDYQTKFILMQSPVGRASEESERKYEDAGSILLEPARR